MVFIAMQFCSLNLSLAYRLTAYERVVSLQQLTAYVLEQGPTGELPHDVIDASIAATLQQSGRQAGANAWLSINQSKIHLIET